MIDVSDLKPEAVFAGLFNRSMSQGMARIHYQPKHTMTLEEAKEVLDLLRFTAQPDGAVYFDYYEGRVMKVLIGQRTIDERLYDRDNGQGAAETVIRALRTRPEAFLRWTDPVPTVDF
jgi:hypothetical protein